MRLVVAISLLWAVTARADLSLVPERLTVAPCLLPRATGADLDCTPLGDQRPLPVVESYFAHHYALVEHDLLLFTSGYGLAAQRARDRLLLFNRPRGGASAAVSGFGLFTLAMIASAHAPSPLRPLFDGDIHFGPAIYQSGMGLGIGGRF